MHFKLEACKSEMEETAFGDNTFKVTLERV